LRTRWYHSLTLRLLAIFWFLLLAAASISLYAAFSITRPPAMAPVSEDFERSLSPVFATAATSALESFPAFQPGRLLVGNYRILARQEIPIELEGEPSVASEPEFAPGLHPNLVIQIVRLLQQEETQEIPVAGSLLAGPFSLENIHLVVSRPLNSEEMAELAAEDDQEWLPRLLTLAAAITGLGALILGVWFVRPLMVLRNATREIAVGEAYPNLKKLPKRKDELGELARAMKRTALELATSRDAQRRLLSDISHELRSPLARSQIALDLLHDDVPEENLHVQQLQKDIHRLGHIIDSILWLSRLENGLDEPITDDVSIQVLLEEIKSDLKYGKDDWGARLHVELEGIENNLFVLETDAILLRLILENLIRNAFQYGPRDTPVTVNVVVDDAANTCSMTIRDQGEGVPEEKLQQLFTPFFRADPSRHHGAGVGLGLALCQRAAHVLSGEISAQNHVEGGFAVTLSVPCRV